ncbi:hypothetical protein Dimus_021638 [Dionaea muscipula]
MVNQSMEVEEVALVNDAVHKLQMHLLEGIEDNNQLYAAWSLMARGDYEDVVAERFILNLCGNPLCRNTLSSEQPKKGRYRASLKEHKVYDLHETSIYCSTGCLINSRTFARSLPKKRCSVVNAAKINDILQLFQNMSLNSDEDLGSDGDMGLSKLKIQEKTDVEGGEVTFEEWIGPANAIEGYVPERDPKYRLLKPEKRGSEHSDENDSQTKPLHVEHSKASPNQMDIRSVSSTSVGSNEDPIPLPSDDRKRGSKSKKSELKKGKNGAFSDANFTSVIITQDEYSISKEPLAPSVTVLNKKDTGSKGKLQLEEGANQFTVLIDSSDTQIGSGKSSSGDAGDPSPFHNHINPAKCSVVGVNMIPAGKAVESSKTSNKSSLKASGGKKAALSVTWADEKNDVGDLCEVLKKLGNTEEGSQISKEAELGDDVDLERLASAKACAIALNQAAEAVACGLSNEMDAVSEAGIILLPQPQTTIGGECLDEDSKTEADLAFPKWPSNMVNSEDSWCDTPPEGFSLTLSPFGMMWNALFAWITSSSLAYIYGRDESSHLEYMCVNGTEYPQKIVLADGRSSEIKQTLAGCLARALPGVIADLKVPTPTSALEHGLGLLLNTMSFVDALPPFRMKQWQVIVLLFIDALSVCRIPGLTLHWTSRRMLIPKVLEGSKIGPEEYKIMMDFMLPLGRVP